MCPLEYVGEMNAVLKAMLATGAGLKKVAASKWMAYHKEQAKKPSANAPEADKSAGEMAKEAAVAAQTEWLKYTKVLLLVALPAMSAERARLLRDSAASFAAVSRLRGESVAGAAMHLFEALNAKGAAAGADSGGWSLATITAASDAALADANEEVKLSLFKPSGDAASPVAAVPALEATPEVAGALPAPKPAPPPVPAAPAPKPAPPPVPAAPAAKPAPPPVPAAPAAAADPAANLFGDLTPAVAAAAPAPTVTADDLFGDDDGGV